MVVLLTPFGQRSNKLFQHIHLDSFCREHGIRFYNEFIQDMGHEYPNVGKPDTVLNLLHKIKIPQILNRLHITKYLNFDSESSDDLYKKVILNNSIVYCDGWLFRSHDTVRKYRSFYQELFKPAVDEAYLYEAFLKKNSSSEKIVGVHIRRGDYKEFEGGRYFYEDSVYIQKLQHLQALLGGDCKIIVFSNDSALDTALYESSLKHVVFSKNSVIVDHYLMSKCDYLLGPPSTFSMWASYIGEVPLYHIETASDDVSLNDFKIFYA